MSKATAKAAEELKQEALSFSALLSDEEMTELCKKHGDDCSHGSFPKAPMMILLFNRNLLKFTHMIPK